MIPSPTILIAAALALSLAAGGSYLAGRAHGDEAGASRVQAAWNVERAARFAAESRAIAHREAEAERLARHLKEQTDAHTATVERLRASESAASRELVRLRATVATAQRTRDVTAPAAARPAPDGAAPGPGQLLGECGARLVELGGSADRLAAQVIGLQGYARTAQEACGR